MLRGIAVVLVVLFHLGLPGFGNGFLGVDAFFVISGFLMAVLCGRETAWAFYKRRARRLLPAYFATIAAVLTASTILTLPSEHPQVAAQVLFASVFASNMGFWLQNSYFSKAEFSPLLHLWSLGVEIQFYAIAPLIFWLAGRNRWIVPLVLLGSLVGCFLLLGVSTKSSFFLMPCRIWQFLTGWLVATYFATEGAVSERFYRPGTGVCCLGILLATLSIPLAPEHTNVVLGHPAAASALVSVATGGVLAFGLPKSLQSGGAGRALSAVGDWSYSIYLAHFPVIVLFLYVPFSGTILKPPTYGELATVVVAIALLSAALYFVVERKFKLRSVALAPAGAFALMLAAQVSKPINALTVSEPERRIISALTDRGTFRCGLPFRMLNPIADFCELPSGSAHDLRNGILLVGDSHADAIKEAFVRVASEAGYRVYLTVANGSLLRGRHDDKWLLRVVSRAGVSQVVFHFSPGNLKLDPIKTLGEQLAGRGINSALLLPVPTYSKNVPASLYMALRGGPSAILTETLAERDAWIKPYVESKRGLTVYETVDIFCRAECQTKSSDGLPYYFDESHLTLTGAGLLESRLAEIVAQGAPTHR